MFIFKAIYFTRILLCAYLSTVFFFLSLCVCVFPPSLFFFFVVLPPVVKFCQNGFFYKLIFNVLVPVCILFIVLYNYYAEEIRNLEIRVEDFFSCFRDAVLL